MRFPEVLKQPSTFVAAALVTACLVALVAAIGGFLMINGVTQSALSVRPTPVVSTSGDGAVAESMLGVPAVLRDTAS